MKKSILLVAFLLAAVTSFAGVRENLWPKGKMPDRQDQQIAAMTDETSKPDFKPEAHRQPYLEWYDAPAADVRNGSCMILISGGGYRNTCDVGFVAMWAEKLTAVGVQCVKLVYRTPRPEGIPYYKTAWDDGQRAVRMVRSEAKKRGFDPEKIGIVSQSAGSHMGLLLAANSETQAYEKVDKLDSVPCHINWAIVNSPAYATSDAAELGSPAARAGYGPDVTINPIYKFDSHTCPMCFLQGGADIYSPNGSTLIYRQLRRMGIPAEVHLYPDKPHGAYGFDRAIEFLRQMSYLGQLAPEEKILDRFASDADQREVVKEDVWPEGKMPNASDEQCKPYIEWHFPKVLKTKAIQIIYSGGSYTGNSPESFEVMPARRYLNALGMTVVTMKYRTPRPKGLAKHTTAWQDLQRAIRIVRSEAAGRGLDPDRIGIMGSSAGGHLTLMGVTSSLHQSYLPIDKLDEIPCNVQWGIGIYPAYVLSDGAEHENKTKGNADDVYIVKDFSFDLKTAPMLFVHGDADGWAAMNSVKVWEKMRAMGIQSELHTLALRKHCFMREASPGTGSYNYLDRIWDFLTHKGFNK